MKADVAGVTEEVIFELHIGDTDTQVRRIRAYVKQKRQDTIRPMIFLVPF